MASHPPYMRRPSGPEPDFSDRVEMDQSAVSVVFAHEPYIVEPGERLVIKAGGTKEGDRAVYICEIMKDVEGHDVESQCHASGVALVVRMIVQEGATKAKITRPKWNKTSTITVGQRLFLHEDKPGEVVTGDRQPVAIIVAAA